MRLSTISMHEIQLRNYFLKICVQNLTKTIFFPPHFARTRAHNQLNKSKQQLKWDLPLSNNKRGLQGLC